METIYSKMRTGIERDKARYMCDALSPLFIWENEKALWSAVKCEINLALTHNGVMHSTVEGYLLRTKFSGDMRPEDLRAVAKCWRLDWLQKKHEDATIKTTHEKYLPTTYKAKHHHIQDLAAIKHELERVQVGAGQWVCPILDSGQFKHREELRALVAKALEYNMFITAVAQVKGAKFEVVGDSASLTFPDARPLSLTEYRIGWIDWLLNNTEE